MDELRAQASDPSTPGLDLQQLATNAELRPLIAKNPAAYTGLLDWLVNKNEPEVIAALRERQAAFEAGQMMPMPTLPLPSSSETPTPSEPATPATPAVTPTETATPQSQTPAIPDSAATPADTATPQPQTPVTPDSAATPATGETPSVSPNRTSILGQNPAETTVLPPQSTPVSAPVPTSGLPPSYPPNAAPNQGAGMGSYGTPAAAQTQYMAPVTGNIPVMSPTPAPYMPTAAKPKSNTVLWVIFSVLLVAVIGMVVAIVLVMTGVIGGDYDQPDTDSPNAAGNTASETPPATEKTPDHESSRQTVAPAPPSAQNIQSFVTETGDSTCQVDGDELICQVRNLVSSVAGCEPNLDSLVVSMRDGDPSATCQPNQDYSPSGGVIPHETAMTYGDFACESTYNGTQCWNTMTGKGFFFAKQDYHQQDAAGQ